MHVSIFLLLNFLVFHGYCMFNPMGGGKRGGCVDVKAYFAVDNEESDNESSEDGDDFFDVENLEVTESQKNQNSLLQNSLRQNSLAQRNANSQSSLTQNSLALQNQKIQNSLNLKNLNSQSSLVQNSLSSQTQNNKNSFVVQSDVSTAGACSKEVSGNCESGWKSFMRPSGEWCMKVFYETYIAHSDAIKKCEAEGAKLSGFQNQHEMLYVTYTVVDHIFPTSGMVWVGMKRKDECLKQPRRAKCTESAFEWTDGSASGSEGFHWARMQPNNHGLIQDCGMLLATPNRTADGYLTSTLDDAYCVRNWRVKPYLLRTPKAYVCGKKPKH